MNFNKTFSFTRETEHSFELKECISLTTPDTIQQDEFMMEMKSELNAVKEKLSQFDIGDWNQHTTRMNPASKVVKTVSSEVRPRPFCSNAWCKFYELLVTLRLLEDLDLRSALRTLHLCEAPGGFVCSLHHFIQSEFKGLEHEWLANTLNPYHEQTQLGEMIPDDRLIRYSLDRWLFGLDNTGDVTKSLNRKHIVQQAKESLGSNIRLVTADGSLDCQLSPSEQEMIVYPLILAEVHIALSLLAKSGVFVLKMFTLFETQTISLLYLLNSLFKHVDIHKPVTSKPGNSEVYVVCKCLLAEVSDNILSLIQSALDTGGPLMSLSEIPRSFLQQVRTAAAKFKDMQEQTITKNMSTYGTQVTFISNEKYAREYLSRMRLKPIPADQSVVVMSYPRTKPVKGCSINSYGSKTHPQQWKPRKRRLSGNFSERCSNFTADSRLRDLLVSTPLPVQVMETLHFLETASPTELSSSLTDLFKLVAVPSAPEPSSRVHNSCFCDGDLLSDYNVLADKYGDTLSQVQDGGLNKITHSVRQYSVGQLPIVPVSSDRTELKENSLQENVLFIAQDLNSNLEAISSIFEQLKPGDSLLIHNINCLTRLGASIVFLLWHCFSEVAIAGHNESSHLPSILFQSCSLTNPEIRECLLQFQCHVTDQLTNQMAALSFIPTPVIMECTTLHNSFLCEVNAETLRRSINSLISHAKTLPSSQ